MDNIDRLIEMLEKRFGKLPADALLLMTVLGAAAWGFHTFVVDFVRPTAVYAAAFVNFLQGRAGKVILVNSSGILFQVAWAVACIGMFWGLYEITIFPTLRRNHRRGAALIKYLDDARADITLGIDSIRDAITQAKAAGVDVSQIKLKLDRIPTAPLGEIPEVRELLERFNKLP